MKVFQLSAEPRMDLGKKATKQLRAEGNIPAVLNGGEVVTLPYTGQLQPGEKLVEIGDGKGLISTDLFVTNEAVRKLVYTPDIFAIELSFNGQTKMAIVKDIQFDPVKAIYTQVPERLIINVDHLGLGKSIQVGELHFEGLEMLNAKNAVVCAVQLTRAARGAAAAANK